MVQKLCNFKVQIHFLSFNKIPEKTVRAFCTGLMLATATDWWGSGHGGMPCRREGPTVRFDPGTCQDRRDAGAVITGGVTHRLSTGSTRGRAPGRIRRGVLRGSRNGRRRHVMVAGATCRTATGGDRRRLSRIRRSRGRGRGRRCPGGSPSHPEFGGADGEAGEGRRRRRFVEDGGDSAGEDEDDGVDPRL